MKRRPWTPLLALLVCALLAATPALAQDFDDLLDGDEEALEESERLLSAEESIGDFFPTTLTGIADLMILRTSMVLVYGVSLAGYAGAVGPVAIFGGSSDVRDLTSGLVVDPFLFLFTRPLGGALDDRWGNRPEFE
jgi:hypothetical protein